MLTVASVAVGGVSVVNARVVVDVPLTIFTLTPLSFLFLIGKIIDFLRQASHLNLLRHTPVAHPRIDLVLTGLLASPGQ